MDLHLTSEQTLLRDSAVKFIQAAGPKVARAFREQDPSFALERLRWTGQKTFVCADGADGFLVSASGPDEPALCYVARNARGCSLTTTQTVEGRKLATLGLAQAPADLIPPHPSSRNAVEALYNLALMALSCELLGVMERAQEITLDYLRIRKQFGKLMQLP